MHEDAAGAVDHRVRDHGRDDVALERMARHDVGVALLQQRREVARERLADVLVVDERAGDEVVGEHHFRVREQHRALRRGKALLGRAPLGDLVVRGQVLHGAIELAGLLEGADERGLGVEELLAAHAGDREGLGLVVVVGEHQARDVVGHLREQLVPLLLGKLAIPLDDAEQDLDVDFVVGAIDTRGVVDGVGVDPPAIHRVLDAPELREAKVAALAHHLAAQLAAIHADRVVGAVADLGVRLPRGLHVGADAAVVEQVRGRFEYRLEELRRRELVGLDRERGFHLGRDRDRLRRARMDPAAPRDHLRVVIRP